MSRPNVHAGKQVKLRRNGRVVFRLIIFLIIVLITVVCGRFSYKYVMQNHTPSGKSTAVHIPEDKQIAIEIPRGSGTKAVAEILKEMDLIKYPFIFQLMSKVNGFDGMYKSGTHIVSKGLKYEDLMHILISRPASIKITIPEGFTYQQIVNLLSTHRLIDKDRFNEIADNGEFDYKFLQGIPPGEKRLEGYLFPDTYEFEVGADEREIIDIMLRNFNRKFKDEYYEKAESLNMSSHDIVILASIIEREARFADERDIISGVFYNRLNNKDKTLKKLQSCATIQYIYLNKNGEVKEKITEEDTQMDNPYNTYMYEGLPPGPISSPGEDAIIAALFPDDTDYLYFAARGDGSHVFSKTYKEHQAAVNKYGLN